MYNLMPYVYEIETNNIKIFTSAYGRLWKTRYKFLIEGIQMNTISMDIKTDDICFIRQRATPSKHINSTMEIIPHYKTKKRNSLPGSELTIYYTIIIKNKYSSGIDVQFKDENGGLAKLISNYRYRTNYIDNVIDDIDNDIDALN